MPKDHKRSSKGAYMGAQKRNKAVSNYASVGNDEFFVYRVVPRSQKSYKGA